MNSHRHSNSPGITSIEALILALVLAGFFALVIYPAAMGPGEKGKARVLEAMTKSIAQATGARMKDFNTGTAMVFEGQGYGRICLEPAKPSKGRDCATLYPTIKERSVYAGLADIINAFAIEHNVGRQERSPFTGRPMVVISDVPEPGHITIRISGQSPGDQGIAISAWRPDGSLLYKSDVSTSGEISGGRQ